MGVNHGGRVPDFEVGTLMQLLSSRFSKNTAQNSPKHAISSENSLFFLGYSIAHPQTHLPVDPTPRPEPSLLYLPVRAPRISARSTPMGRHASYALLTYDA